MNNVKPKGMKIPALDFVFRGYKMLYNEQIRNRDFKLGLYSDELKIQVCINELKRCTDKIIELPNEYRYHVFKMVEGYKKIKFDDVSFDEIISRIIVKLFESFKELFVVPLTDSDTYEGINNQIYNDIVVGFEPQGLSSDDMLSEILWRGHVGIYRVNSRYNYEEEVNVLEFNTFAWSIHDLVELFIWYDTLMSLQNTAYLNSHEVTFNVGLIKSHEQEVILFVDSDKLGYYKWVENELLERGFLDMDYNWCIPKSKQKLLDLICCLDKIGFFKKIVKGKKVNIKHYRWYVCELFGLKKNALTNALGRYKPNYKESLISFYWLDDYNEANK